MPVWEHVPSKGADGSQLQLIVIMGDVGLVV
jgi:hypothetical protein